MIHVTMHLGLRLVILGHKKKSEDHIHIVSRTLCQGHESAAENASTIVSERRAEPASAMATIWADENSAVATRAGTATSAAAGVPSAPARATAHRSSTRVLSIGGKRPPPNGLGEEVRTVRGAFDQSDTEMLLIDVVTHKVRQSTSGTSPHPALVC